MSSGGRCRFRNGRLVCFAATVQPARRRQEVRAHPRFLTCSCYLRKLLLHNPRILDLFAAELAVARSELGFKLYGWVAMPEHFHLLLTPRPPELTVSRILTRLKRPLAKRVIGRWRELNAPILATITDTQGLTRFWQRGGGFDANVHTTEEFYNNLQYIHRNPVTRGLVKQPTDWAHSSARWHEKQPALIDMDLISPY